ncbi:MAG: MFS transporter [Solirubrobacterales bacterium]|nr:MFS transporter [Solirubrobacterales bacterium]
MSTHAGDAAEARIDAAGGRGLVLPFSGLLLVMFIAALDQTIMATALPTIAGDLGGLGDLSWVVTVYVLAAAATTPIWGKASDLYGRKGLLRAAIVVFIAGSALSGAAQSIAELIAFRALQGIGAGGLMTLAMATVGDLVPPRERGRYQGYIQIVFVLASVAGPLLGGLFVDRVSWRWALYVNVPIGALALAVLTAYLHVPAPRREGRVDFLGAALLAAAVVALLLLTVWGGDRYAWSSPQIIGLTVAALGLLGAFIVQERRASEPVLPLRLFRERVFVVVSAVLFITTLSLFAALVFLPLFLQLVTGASATQSGLLVLPLLLASAASTVASGWIMAATGRYKVFPLLGLVLMSVGLFLFATLGTNSSRAAAAMFMVVFGLGFGMVTQILMVAIQNAVDPREIGTATASANLFRALGGSVGTAAYGAIFVSGLRHWLPERLPGAGRLPAGIEPNGIQASPGRIHTLAPAVQHGVAQAVANSLHDVFLVAAPIAFAGFLIALLLRERPLRTAGAGPRGEPEAPEVDDEPEPQASEARGERVAA